MKQIISIEQWNELSDGGKSFVSHWKRVKGYPQESPLLTLGQCVEFLVAVSHQFYHEEILYGVRNNALMLDEATVAWDGEELIDILWYYIVRNVRKRLARTFNDIVNDPILPLDKSEQT